mmetsp:Transcript_31504/g.64242  ORF Transcript_31504/g.64242 Transcript_31504/m.64242 type:complete len:726 (-) Transcript_31504:838-3015(-)
MPLHEYLEKKRRENIQHLNSIGSCHICGSTCRKSHFRNGQPAPMRTCSCFGVPPDDPNHWPFSLRVCEMCIADDTTTGRILSCGICGTVACDENCGEELVECTDQPEWNNAGCLECRGKEAFSDLAIFKPKPNWGDPPCIMRVCAKCLDLATPWVKYDFVCRRLKCNTRLVPSYVIERKRSHTFKSSPLNTLPEDGLLAIVDFLAGKDLQQLYLTNSLFCTVAEKSARAKVENVNEEFPSGPIKTIKSITGKVVNIAEGTNPFALRAPEDCKAWVGLLKHLETITKDSFYFEDILAASNYLQNTDKFAFGPRYEQEAGAGTRATSIPITPLAMSLQYPISITGGLLHVNRKKDDARVSQIAAGKKTLRSGVHCIIFRSSFPMPERVRLDTNHVMCAVGVLRRKRDNEVTWAHKVPICDALGKETDIVGLKYNTNTRDLTILRPHVIRNEGNRMNSNTMTLPEMEGDLMFAVELTPMGLAVQNSLLSVRECSSEEWLHFHVHSPNIGPLEEARRDPDVFDRFMFDEMQGDMNDDERPNEVLRFMRHANRRRIREEHRARVRRAGRPEPHANLPPNENLDQNNAVNLNGPGIVAIFGRQQRDNEMNAGNRREGNAFDLGFPQDLLQEAARPAGENGMIPQRLGNFDGDSLSDSDSDWHDVIPENGIMLGIAQNDPEAGDIAEDAVLADRHAQGFAGPVELEYDGYVIWHDDLRAGDESSVSTNEAGE